MDLDDRIRDHAQTVQTQSYSMSISELASMYNDGEMNLHPEFQRFFRWTAEQKSRFIESLILGIPIPPVFVSEREDAKWEVIDGVQRISTILEAMGELTGPDGALCAPLKLTRTHYLPELEGRSWSSDDPNESLSEMARIRIKRARIDVNIVQSGSDDDTKFEVFQRLNTGGSQATEQEIRNCLLVMRNPEHFSWLSNLSEDDDFRGVLPLTDKAIQEAYPMELVSRYAVLSQADLADLTAIDELGSYLNRAILKQASDPNFSSNAVQDSFREAFAFLNSILGENAFKKYDNERGKYTGPMLISLYEVLAVSLGSLLQEGESLPDGRRIEQRHTSLWQELNNEPYVGSGVRASTRIPKTIEFGKKWLKR